MARTRWTAAEVQAARKEKLEEFEANVRQRVEQLVTGDDWLDAMRFAARFRSYSFLNTLAIYVQHQEAFREGRVREPVPTLVAGRTSWKANGRWPTQPGYVIRKPVFARFASTNPASGVWRRLGYWEKPRTGEVVRRELVNVKPVKVWDISQTDGKDIPQRPRPVLLTGRAPAGLWDGLATEVASAGYTLTEAPDAAAIGGANGVTNFTARTVQVRADMDDAARVKTLAHETGHVRLHDPEAVGTPGHYGIEEVKAESFATMLCAMYGMDTGDYSIPYVAGWASSVPDTTPSEVMVATGDQTVKSVLSLLEHLPEPLIDDGKLAYTPPPARTRSRRTASEGRRGPDEAVRL
ncbi:serine/arginine repetitive matrix protein 2 [Microbacterium keratanolyticum]